MRLTKPASQSRRVANLILSYVISNGIHLIIIALNLLLLFGLFCYPVEVGVYMLAPYYAYTKLISRTELKDGCRWQWFSEHFFIFPALRRHLHLQLDVSEKLVQEEKKQNAQFIFAAFPHGTASTFRALMDGMLHEHLPKTSEKLRVLAASVLFMIPLLRELSVWTGCVDARRSVAERALKKGCSIFVLPGGEAEQIRTIYKRERVYLKNRKGFIKLAMRQGVDVVPVYVFGESDLFYTSNFMFSPRLWLQKNFGVCIPLTMGMWGSFFCPLPVKTTIVFGEPVNFQMKDLGSPTREELDVAHAKFCASLISLFDAHKTRLGFADRELEIL